MNIAIHTNNSKKSIFAKKQLESQLINHGFTLKSNNPDIIISIGGDGTLLSSFHKYIDFIDTARFFGIHTGHLGFYTDYFPEEINKIVKYLVNDNKTFISYPLVEASFLKEGKILRTEYAINEVSLRRVGNSLVFDSFIDNKYFESLRGDGVIISTPTGSTGYNKSLGGAVVSPKINAFQVAEIASINNNMYRSLGSPLVLSSEDNYVIKPKKGNFAINIDNEKLFNNSFDEMVFKISKKHRIKFVNYDHNNFWDRVKDSFLN